MHEITHIGVIGAGTMGHGVAQLAAMAGYETCLYDIDQARVDGGLEHIRSNFAGAIERGKATLEERDQALARLRTTTRLEEVCDSVGMVIEAAPEQIELKKELFAKLSALTSSETVLATNTSSLSVTEIAAAATHSERVLGVHFFNPVHVMKLLELVRADQTSEWALQRAHDVGRKMGKELIVINDSAGFASSRLGLVLGLEAMRMVEQGVASPDDIDRAMVYGYRHPMGPLRVTDLVGLDVRLAIAEYLHAEIGEQFRPPQILRKLVRAGKLGKKTGEGFYKW